MLSITSVQSTSAVYPRFCRLGRSIRRLAHSVNCDVGENSINLKTGHMARFADAAVVASSGDNAVLATCVHKQSSNGYDGVPLTVDFRQSAAAVGRIPTNYLRRELGQSDADILASRVIDRSIRPLIQSGWTSETQIICKPLSIDDDGDSVLLGLNAATCAMDLSSIPMISPIAGVRVAIVDEKVVLNPPRSVLRDCSMDMILSGTTDRKVVMLEMEGHQISQELVLEAIQSGLDGVDRLLHSMAQLREKAGKEKNQVETKDVLETLKKEIRDLCVERIEYVFTDSTHDKISRDMAIKDIEADVLDSFDKSQTSLVQTCFRVITKEILRSLVLETSARCDGRSIHEFRPISIEVDVYKKLHGSALFQRGQTQVLSTVTFDSPSAAFHPDSISQLLGGQQKKSFMLHYEFPAYATNEIGNSRGANRRELGHGALAEKSLKNVMPKDFPYAIRVSSQVLESNGSSSMASACSGSLALFDAGVPIAAPVAGVAIGLITNDSNREDDYKILTDILGIEDHAGDMDFKVAGTRNGFTAMQLDIKIPGLTPTQLSEALHRGTEGISFVLDKMASSLPQSRDNFKPTVPVLETMHLEQFKRAMIFRNGGYIAKNIEAETDVKISVDDDTHICMIAPNRQKLSDAKEMLQRLLNEGSIDDYNFGQMVNAEVVEILDRGVLVTLQPGGKKYIVPNSQLSTVKVNHPTAAGIKTGQKMVLQWLGRDGSGNVRLSRKPLSGSAAPVTNNFRK